MDALALPRMRAGTSDGTICMEFEKRHDRTVATRLFRHGNSRISSAMAVPDSDPYYYLISTGGGYTEGEHYEVDIDVGEEAHAILTTQTPAYIYKCDHGKTTSQRQAMAVGPGGFLEYYADEVMPYANARFAQLSEVHLAKGAALIYADGLSSGWSPDAEPFRFASAFLSTSFFREGKLIALDRLAVTPREWEGRPRQGGGIGIFEGHSNFGSVLILDEKLKASDAEGFRKATEAALDGTCRIGISPIDAGGMALRILAPDEQHIDRIVHAFCAHYREDMRHLAPLRIRKNRS